MAKVFNYKKDGGGPEPKNQQIDNRPGTIRSALTWVLVELGIRNSSECECGNCKKPLSESDNKIQCPGWKCIAVFCQECIIYVKTKCPVCETEYHTTQEPISEEEDSSFDDFSNLFTGLD